MTPVLFCLGVFAMVLPHLLPRWSSPAAASRWTVTSTSIGLRLIQAAAVLTAAPIMFRAVGVHPVADACDRLISPAPPGSPAGPVIVVAAFGMLARSAWVTRRIVRGRDRTRVESDLGKHQPFGPIDNTELVVLPTGQWLAYAVPGSPNQLVISEGVRTALTDDELTAVLSHEVAHLRFRHHRALRLLAELDGLFGQAGRRLTDRVRLLLERAADDAAASTCGVAPLHMALCAASGPAPSHATRTRRHALRHPVTGPYAYQWVLPATVLSAVAAAGIVLAGTALKVDHGVLGLLGLCLP
jgi:hypothetical protein